jgi:protocatechuate 3,4-dioxygenase beta subunit
MKSTRARLGVIAVVICLAGFAWGQPPPASLRGVVTDPAGAVVPNALVQLRGPQGEQRASTDIFGEYRFASLAHGRYQVQ